MGDHRAVVGKHAETVLSEIKAETTLQTQWAALQVLKVKEKEIEKGNNEMGGTPDVVLKRKRNEADEEMRKLEEMFPTGKGAKPMLLKKIKESLAQSLRNNLLAEEVNPVEILVGS